MTTGIAPGFAPKETDSLQTRIGWYTMNGYVVESQTETSAQLVAPKGKFAWGWFISWWFIPGPGPFFYAVYHFTIKKKRVVDLYLEDGKVKGRYGPGALTLEAPKDTLTKDTLTYEMLVAVVVTLELAVLILIALAYGQ